MFGYCGLSWCACWFLLTVIGRGCKVLLFVFACSLMAVAVYLAFVDLCCLLCVNPMVVPCCSLSVLVCCVFVVCCVLCVAVCGCLLTGVACRSLVGLFGWCLMIVGSCLLFFCLLLC